MSQQQTGWLLLLVLSLLMIIVGIQGNAGVVLAILFCPAYVTIDTTGG